MLSVPGAKHQQSVIKKIPTAHSFLSELIKPAKDTKNHTYYNNLSLTDWSQKRNSVFFLTASLKKSL